MQCHACRYLTDHMETLPLGMLARIVTVNDSLLTLVPLLEKKPWQRRHVRCLLIVMCSKPVPLHISFGWHLFALRSAFLVCYFLHMATVKMHPSHHAPSNRKRPLDHITVVGSGML